MNSPAPATLLPGGLCSGSTSETVGAGPALRGLPPLLSNQCGPLGIRDALTNGGQAMGSGGGSRGAGQERVAVGHRRFRSPSSSLELLDPTYSLNCGLKPPPLLLSSSDSDDAIRRFTTASASRASRLCVR